MNRLLQALCCVLVLASQATLAAPPAIPPGPPPAKTAPRPQLVATRGLLPNTLSSGSNTYTRNDVRQWVSTGAYPVSDLRIAFSALYANGNDIPLPNPITVSAGIESASPALTQRVFFAGQPSVTIAPGAPLVLSDPVAMDFPAATGFWVRTSVSVATPGQQWGLAAAFSVAGDGHVDSTSATDQVAATGNLTTPSGGNGAAPGHAPLGIIGIPTKRFPAVCLNGDSIIAGNGESSGGDMHGNFGFAARGLYLGNGAGVPVPYTNLARSGEAASQVAGNVGATRRAMLQYCTHVLENYGTNDLAGGQTLAQLQANKLRLWQTYRAHGLQIYVANLMPRTTDATGTTPVANFGPGGLRDQYNAWLKTQVGVTIDGVLDVASVVEDPAHHGQWLAGYTGEGIHPTGAVHAAIATAVIQPWAASLRVPD